MDPTDLERLLETELRRLPAPHAPATLRPRVMAVIAARARRRVHRPWFGWPAAWQVAFIVSLVLVIGGAARWLSPMRAIARAFPHWGGLVSPVVAMGSDAQVASDAARVVILAFVGQPVVWGFVALVLVMASACAVFGGLLGRIAQVGVQGAD